jgi:hypothetical protein
MQFPTLNSGSSNPTATPPITPTGGDAQSFPMLPFQEQNNNPSPQPVQTPQTNEDATVGKTLSTDMSDRVANIQDTTNDYVNGKIGLPQAFMNNVGQVIGGAIDIPMSVVSTVAQNVGKTFGIKSPSSSTVDNLPVIKQLSAILARPEVATYQNAGTMYAHAADLYAQANKTTDPIQKNRLLNLADQTKSTADVIKSNANDIDTTYKEAGRTAEATANIGGLLSTDVNPEENFFARGATDLKNPSSIVSGLKPTSVASAETTPKITTAQSAIQGARNINTTVGNQITTAGQNLESGVGDFEKANPDLKLNISTNQTIGLNDMAQKYNITLPDNIGEGVTPTQTQSLIKQFNDAVRANPDDTQLRTTANQLKSSATTAFKEPSGTWSNLYSTYTKIRAATDKIDNIFTLDPRANPQDIENQITKINNLSKTSTGKELLKQALQEYKETTGIDFSDPLQAIQKVTGNWAHQVGRAVIAPQMVARRIAITVGSILGLGAIGYGTYSAEKSAITKAMSGK